MPRSSTPKSPAPRSPAAPPTHPPLPALRVQISRQPPPALLIGRSFRCLPMAHPRHVIPASARGITGLVVPRRGAGGGAGGGAPSEARRRSAALPQGSLSAGGDPSHHGGTRPAMGTRSVTWPMFSHGANIPSRDVADHVLPCGWVPSWGHVLPRGHIMSQLPTPPSPAQPSPTAGPQRDPSHRHPMGTARGQQRQLPPGLQHPGTALCVHVLRGDKEAGRRRPQPW